METENTKKLFFMLVAMEIPNTSALTLSIINRNTFPKTFRSINGMHCLALHCKHGLRSKLELLVTNLSMICLEKQQIIMSHCVYVMEAIIFSLAFSVTNYIYFCSTLIIWKTKTI